MIWDTILTQVLAFILGVGGSQILSALLNRGKSQQEQNKLSAETRSISVKTENDLRTALKQQEEFIEELRTAIREANARFDASEEARKAERREADKKREDLGRTLMTQLREAEERHAAEISRVTHEYRQRLQEQSDTHSSELQRMQTKISEISGKYIDSQTVHELQVDEMKRQIQSADRLLNRTLQDLYRICGLLLGFVDYLESAAAVHPLPPAPYDLDKTRELVRLIGESHDRRNKDPEIKSFTIPETEDPASDDADAARDRGVSEVGSQLADQP